MRLWRRIGLRSRLALALATVAVFSVALATVFANIGLHSRLDQFARDRMQSAATHSAQLAAGLYRDERRGWTPEIATELSHAAEINGYNLALADVTGRPVGPDSPAEAPGRPSARAPVVVDDRTVGSVSIWPVQGAALSGEDRALRDRLNQLHIVAGALALALGLIVAGVMAPALARPLRRLTDGARRIQRGELRTRVVAGSAPELRELAKAFNRLAETLAQEEEIRSAAAADIAHELRTPLAGVLSRIEAAQDGVLPDERRNLDAMHTEALRLTSLVEDLGQLAEAQRPGLTLHKEMVDLRALVEGRAHVHRDYFEAKGLTFEERLSSATVYGDSGRLAQIVDNLLSNALRYTDAGGHVTIEVAEREGEASIEVRDTGVGIHDDDLSHVFERFWRAEPSRARRTGGTGIGLSIVRELVRAHEGRVVVESRLGEGSCFRVTLPSATSRA